MWPSKQKKNPLQILSSHNNLCRWTQNNCQLEWHGLKAANWDGGWNINCLRAEMTNWLFLSGDPELGCFSHKLRFGFAWMCSACMTPCACGNVTPQTRSLEVSGNIKETDWAKWWSCRANPCGERSLRVTAFNYHCTRKRVRITCQHFWAPQTFGCLVIENAQRVDRKKVQKITHRHRLYPCFIFYLKLKFAFFFIARRNKSNIYVQSLCCCSKCPYSIWLVNFHYLFLVHLST